MDYNQVVEYIGINTNYSPYINSFKETIVEDTIFINNSSEIQYITKFSVTIKADVGNIIKTSTGVNLDNLKLTGVLSTVNLLINGRLEYLDNNNSICLYSFSMPYIIHIALPENFNSLYNIVPKSYIQHMSVKKLSDRAFYFNLLALIALEF